MIGKDGGSISDDQKLAVVEWPCLNTLSELHSFAGPLQFFRRFTKSFPSKAAPLTDLTRKHGRIGKCNLSCDNAFKIPQRHAGFSRYYETTRVNITIQLPCRRLQSGGRRNNHLA